MQEITILKYVPVISSSMQRARLESKLICPLIAHCIVNTSDSGIVRHCQTTAFLNLQFCETSVEVSEEKNNNK